MLKSDRSKHCVLHHEVPLTSKAAKILEASLYKGDSQSVWFLDLGPIESKIGVNSPQFIERRTNFSSPLDVLMG